MHFGAHRACFDHLGGEYNQVPRARLVGGTLCPCGAKDTGENREETWEPPAGRSMEAMVGHPGRVMPEAALGAANAVIWVLVILVLQAAGIRRQTPGVRRNRPQGPSVALGGEPPHGGEERQGLLIGAMRRWVPKPKAAEAEQQQEPKPAGQQRKGPKRRGPGQEDHEANPAYRRGVRGYEWVEPLSRGEPYVSKATAAEMVKVMNKHQKDVEGCVFWALLAGHREQEPLDFFDQEWKALTVHECRAVVGRYSRWKRSKVLVYWLNEDGTVGNPEVYGREYTDRTWSIVIVPAGGGKAHAVAIRPQAGARVRVPDLVVWDEEQPPVPVRAEPQVAVEREYPVLEDGVAVVYAPVERRQAVELVPVLRTVDDVRTDDIINHLGLRPVICEPTPERRPTYYGVQRPPDKLQDADWVGGWFATQAHAGEVGWSALISQAARDTVLCRMLAPTYASATLPNFARWGEAVTYVPVRFHEGLQQCGRRSVTDGVEACEFFLPGDSLVCGNSKWSVGEDDRGFIRVTAANLRAKVCFNRNDVKVGPAAKELPAVALHKAEWLVEVSKSQDPVQTGILNRLKADEAAAGYPGTVRAEDAAAVTSQIAKRHHYRQVGAPFLWGYCYSCGAGLPGQMKHRLCKECERGRNTELAELVARGEKVTSLANPMIYPGVVTTESHHPRLKPGVESVASERNFRFPRRA